MPRLIPKRPPRTYLWVEFIALFVAFPTYLYFDRHAFGTRIIPSLLLIGSGCLIVLLLDPTFDRRRLWNTTALRGGVVHILGRLVPSTIVLALLTWWLSPELFLRLPRQQPRLWLMILLLYPVFSVYPQELIFRTFLFHRYRSLWPSSTARIVVSGVAFGLAHVFFANWFAPILSLAGGLMFARTYARTGSTLQATLEHGLWGDVIFTVGLGWYFYGGSIGA